MQIIISLLFVFISICLTYFPQNYLFMLAKSFNIQIMIGSIILGIFLFYKKKWLIASSCFLCSIILFTYINSHLNLLNSDPVSHSLPIEKGREEMIIASFNVLMSNTNYNSTIESALASQADLISFQEIDENWVKELEKKLKDQYPYYELVPQHNLYGIGLFSKYPLENIKVLNFGNVPSISATIYMQNSPIHFICSHLGSPGSYGGYSVRNQQMEDIKQYLDPISYSIIAIGDYNATPWDATIIDFKKQTQLQDSRKNLCATFPTAFWPVMIPLDYIFHSNDIQCLEFKTVENGNSDHKGIVGKYVIK